MFCIQFVAISKWTQLSVLPTYLPTNYDGFKDDDQRAHLSGETS